ncbi:MAG: toprim domain-containing protein [Candidatus Atabeyarchaeum deiterrae]|jgi:5S rRNA maturation endonuclease (ribonuclease M5)
MRKVRLSESDKIEKMSNIFMELFSFSSEGVPILVEGRKDEDALKELGVKGRIIRIRRQRKKLFELAEELSPYKKVVVLADFDKEGEALAREISRYLQLWGVQTIMRDKIRNAISWATREIEGVKKIGGLQEKLNNKQFIVDVKQVK